MNKNTFWLITLLFAFSFGFISCAEETPEVNPYEDWEGCNELYLDSIVKVARNHPADEDWKIYKNYKIEPSNTEGNMVSPVVLTRYDSVYVKVLREGDGIIPMSSDTVSVAYQGFLITGERFDGNYVGKFNPEVQDNFTNFGVSQVIPGWTTALLYMKEKTIAEIYVPAKMGYGDRATSSIPANSVLKFEVYLDKVIHPKGPDGRSLKLNKEELVRE